MQGKLSIRFHILMIIIVIIGILFICKLFDLQIVNGAEYRQQSENRLVREVKTYAPRGEIYDRYGKLMVTNSTAYAVNLYYTKISKEQLNQNLLEVAKILEKNGDKYYNHFPINFEEMTFTQSEESAKLWKKEYQIDENASVIEVINFFKKKYKVEQEDMAEVARILALRYEIGTEGYSSFRSVTLARGISEASMHEIEERGSELSGIVITTYPVRKYVTGSTASHILGYIGSISSSEYEERKDKGYTQNDMIGKTGIEASLEEQLKGTDGIKRLEMDADGQLTSKVETEESKMGNSVVLTIDLDLQTKAEEVLAKYIQKIQKGEFAEKFADADSRSSRGTRYKNVRSVGTCKLSRIQSR